VVLSALGSGVQVQVADGLALTHSHKELFSQVLEQSSARQIQGFNGSRNFNQFLDGLSCLSVAYCVVRRIDVLNFGRESEVVQDLLETLANGRVVLDLNDLQALGPHETISNELRSGGSQTAVRKI